MRNSKIYLNLPPISSPVTYEVTDIFQLAIKLLASYFYLSPFSSSIKYM